MKFFLMCSPKVMRAGTGNKKFFYLAIEQQADVVMGKIYDCTISKINVALKDGDPFIPIEIQLE